MLLSFGKATMVCSLLAVGTTLSRSTYRASSHTPTYAPESSHTPHQILLIRVSQESSPGAGDFDTHILGFVRALQTTGDAADFYMYGRIGPNYGNTIPALTSNTSHIFFVNAVDGLALFVVQNNTNHAESGNGGTANTRWELSGGTASILRADDDLSEVYESAGGTVFTGKMDWSSENTDGVVIGALPVGFTILGQFTTQPTGLGGGWEVISDDGTKLPLSSVPGQRVRLDVTLHVRVRQDQ